MPSKSETPVSIHIETFHSQDGQTEEYAQDFAGQLIQIGPKIYLRYQEELSGDQQATVTFKIGEDHEVQLTRKMETQKLHLTFVPGKRMPSHYQTAYGNIPVTACASRTNQMMTESPLAGRVEIDYQLFNGEMLLGDYKIRLQFKA